MTRCAQDAEPEFRIGNCCGCNEYPIALFKIPGVYRYRCADCFKRETGYAHYLAQNPIITASPERPS